MATLSEPTQSSGARPVFWKAGGARLLGTTALAGLLTGVLVAPVRADSSWTGAVSSDWFNAGNWSNGVPTANDNALIQNNNLPNGAVVGATGASAGRVLIGDSANGSLTIQNGGTLDVSVLTGLGDNAGVSGLLVVTGAGSTLTSPGGLAVGFFGPATLLIANGGTVISGGSIPTPFAGAAALGTLGSTGTAVVDGTGSLWKSTDIAIGQFGTGMLTVSNGGTVAGILKIAQGPSSTGTLNIGAASGVGATAPGVVSGPSVQFGDGTGTIVFNHSSSNYVFAPVISGAGSIQVNNGTTIFTGTNTYTGGTTMTHGVLQLGNGGTTGSITGDVANNTTLAFNRSNTYQFDGVISGAGAVDQDGTGTTTLTATNTYSGGTAFTAGTVSVSSDANLGNATGGLSFNGGTLQVTGTTFNSTARTITWGAGGGGFDIDAAANNFTVSQALTGGPLTKSGAGTLTLSGANTYTGATTINGGTVHVTNAFTVLSTATLIVNNTGTYTIDRLLTNSGAIQVDAGGTLTATAGGITNNFGATILNNGRIDDALNNGGTATNNLTYNADVATNTGTITNSATGTWTGNVITNASNATGITNDGVWVGNVQANTGTINNNNTWTGTVTSSGTFNNNSPGTVSGLLTNSGTAGNGGTLSGGLANTAGTMTNTGTINGGATVSGGTLNTNTSASAINGGLTNTATVNAQGQVNGAIANNAGGTFNATGDLTGNSTFANANGANLNVNAGTYTSTGLVTNNGALAVANGATLTSTINGITNNATGTIGNSGTINGISLVNDGAVTNNAGANYNSDLTNGPTGTVANSGNWTGNLTANANSNAGAVSNSGTWIGNADNDIGALINSGTWATTTGFINGGTLTTTGTISGGLTNSGTANAQGSVNGAILNQGAGTFAVTAALAGNNTFTNNGTARLNVTGGDFTGITMLTNNSTNLTGITIATGRTLSANSVVNSAGATIGNLGTITTNSMVDNGTITGAYAMAAGTLSGTGTVQTLAVNDGTFAPGNGTANSSMNVTTSLSFQAAAIFMVQVSPTTASFANVTGTAALGGATVSANFAAGSYVAKQYIIVEATGAVSGTFNPAVVNTNLPSNFHTTLSYDVHDAYLNLALNFGLPGGLNDKQQNVGNALTNFFNTTGTIPLVFGALTPAGLSQASGETATGTQQTTFDAMTQFMGVMTDPFIGGRGDSITAGSGVTPFAEEFDAASAYAAKDSARNQSERDASAAIYRKAPAMVAPFNPGWSVWAAGYGGSQTTNGNTTLGSNLTTSRLAATAVGADYRFSQNTIAGFALAGGGGNFSVANGGVGRSDLLQAGAFVRHTVGPAYFTAALAYGWQDITTDRAVTIAGMDQLRARFNANAWSGRIEDGYRFATPWMGITPYAAAQFTTFDLPAYAERAIVGANTFALAYAAKSVTAARSEVGVRTDKSWAMPDSIFTLRERFAWAHDYNTDRSIGATFQTLPGASFVANGAAQSADKALTTASVEVKWRNGVSLAATFEGEFSNDSSSYAGKGVVRYQW